MKSELKQAVIDLLIKRGNSEKEVIDMMEKHFEFASSKYSKKNQIATYLRAIY